MSCLETGKKFAVLFLSSILLITVLICLSASAEENNAATELTAPDFELQNLQGSNVSLSQFKGQKPVLLYFWATWCPHCMAVRPEVIKMQKADPDDNIEIIAINVGSGDSLAKVQHFEEANPAPYTVLYDTDSKVTRSYKVQGVPHFVLLDKTGAVKYSGSELPSDPMTLLK